MIHLYSDMKIAALTLPLPCGRGVTFQILSFVSSHWGETEGQTRNIAMQFYGNKQSAITQLIKDLNFLKIAKRCNKMKEYELIPLKNWHST